MPGFPGRIRPAFVAAPAEPSVAAQVEDIDRQLTALMLIPAAVRTPVQWSSLDVLLDRRLRLSPAGDAS